MQLQDFYNRLEKFPGDWEFRGIFADWLYDNNNPLEVAQRYFLKYALHPFHCKMSGNYFLWIFGNGNALILRQKYLQSHGVCFVPEEIFQHLNGKGIYNESLWKYYDKLQEAECDLANAITRLLPTS